MNSEDEKITLTKEELNELLKHSDSYIHMPDLSKLDSAAHDVIEGNTQQHDSFDSNTMNSTSTNTSNLLYPKPIDIDKRDLIYQGMSVILSLVIVAIICISILININVGTKSDLKYQQVQISTLKSQNKDLQDKVKESEQSINELSDEIEEFEKQIKEIDESQPSTSEEGEY